MQTDWPFGHLTPLKYGAILADPPWSFKMRSAKGYEKSPEAHYQTMTDKQLLSLPVGQLAGGDCLLVMWAIWPRLPFAIRLMEAWGFRYVTGGAWVKRTAYGKIRWGTGYTLRSGCEPFLIGRMGEPQGQPRNILNVLDAVALEHSRKPPEMRSMVEALTPRAFRCELFAREAWPGNEVWGAESSKFDGPQGARYEPMTGITQTTQRPAPPARPLRGRNSNATEERVIMSMLEAADVEREVAVMWSQKSPEQIAADIRTKRGINRLDWITAKWVESIKRRIDNRKRRD